MSMRKSSVRRIGSVGVAAKDQISTCSSVGSAEKRGNAESDMVDGVCAQCEHLDQDERV